MTKKWILPGTIDSFTDHEHHLPSRKKRSLTTRLAELKQNDPISRLLVSEYLGRAARAVIANFGEDALLKDIQSVGGRDMNHVIVTVKSLL